MRKHLAGQEPQPNSDSIPIKLKKDPDAESWTKKHIRSWQEIRLGRQKEAVQSTERQHTNSYTLPTVRTWQKERNGINVKSPHDSIHWYGWFWQYYPKLIGFSFNTVKRLSTQFKSWDFSKVLHTEVSSIPLHILSGTCDTAGNTILSAVLKNHLGRSGCSSRVCRPGVQSQIHRAVQCWLLYNPAEPAGPVRSLSWETKLTSFFAKRHYRWVSDVATVDRNASPLPDP